jgi:hypothetical protein
MKNIIIFPGSMEAIGQALDIFGEKRVEPGSWNEPVRVNGVTAEEVAAAEIYFGALGCEVKEAREVKPGTGKRDAKAPAPASNRVSTQTMLSARLPEGRVD